METMRDFCEWAGSQRDAARALGVDESTVSRAVRNGPSVRLARRAESVSDGKFLAASLLGLSQPVERKAA